MKLAALLAGCGALLLGACAGPSVHHPRDVVAAHAGKLRGDELRLQGRWAAERKTVPAVSSLVLGRVAYDFHGRRYYSGQAQGGGYYRLDDASYPKRIDFDDGHSPVIRGIYELHGDRLDLCTAPPSSRRPGFFAAYPARQLTTLYRQPAHR